MKALILALLVVILTGCSTTNTKVVEDKWILVSFNGSPGKFNTINGELWLFDGFSWIKIPDRKGFLRIVPNVEKEIR